MAATNIAWTDEVWNPTTGCDKISAGCKNCYADIMANRLQKMGLKKYESGFNVVLHPEELTRKFTKTPKKIFVNSMSDLFHQEVNFSFIDEVFDCVRANSQHVFQVLTKRPERMVRYFKIGIEVPENLWLGVSVENKKEGLPRIDYLRQIDCKVRFLSCEPLLEDLGELDLTDIHWVIVGGESGHHCRPMDLDWARSIKRQCEQAGVAFFFKQTGGIRNGIDLLDGVKIQQYPL